MLTDSLFLFVLKPIVVFRWSTSGRRSGGGCLGFWGCGKHPKHQCWVNAIWTVGINNDESQANSLVGGPGVTEYPPTELESGIFAQPPGSTRALVMTTCLTNEGMDFAAENFVTGLQGNVIALLEDGSSKYGALWAPNSYSYLAGNLTPKNSAMVRKEVLLSLEAS